VPRHRCVAATAAASPAAQGWHALSKAPSRLTPRPPSLRPPRTGTAYANGDAVVGGTIFSLTITVNAICEFVSASFLGELSDAYGRRPFIMLASFGQVLDFLMAAAAAKAAEDNSVSTDYGNFVIAGAGFYSILAGATSAAASLALPPRSRCLLARSRRLRQRAAETDGPAASARARARRWLGASLGCAAT